LQKLKKELFTIIRFVKKALIGIRTSIKLLLILAVAIFIIAAAVVYIYKPIYKVTYEGEFVGYSENKSKLQKRINEYMKQGEGENAAFVQIDAMPEYEMCMLKKNIITNDDEIFNKVKESGTTYYKYYAITLSNEEKYYVSKFEEAESIINKLKEKESTNISKLGFIEKYETELKEFTEVDKVVSDLYVKKKVVTYAAKGVNTSTQKVPLGISLIRPVSGTITSRFGARWGETHTGLDIGAPRGTAIKAAAAGTVTFSGNRGNGYGNYVIISHGNGVETLYGHCHTLNVSAGQTVSLGQTIATVGNTGRSTGNHLHLEIRVNGISQNPQNYLY